MLRDALQRRSGSDEPRGAQTEMWLRGHVASESTTFFQVPSEQNTADAFINHWSAEAATHVKVVRFEASGCF